MLRIAFLSILFISFQLKAQTVNNAAMAVGTQGNDGGYAVVKSNDGGYAIAGYTSCSSCPANLYIFKVDSAYTVQWTRSVGGSNDDYGYSITKTTDGGYAVSGYTSSYGSGGGGIYLVKTDATGALTWSETIEGQRGYSIIQTTDKGFAIAGYTKGCGSCPAKAYVIKTDSAGTVQWAETIGGTSRDTAYSIIQTSDGGYAVAGGTSSFGAGGNDVYVVKLGSAGTLKWSRTIGGTQDDMAYSIIQTSDGGYAVAGGTSSFGAGSSDGYIVKMDSVGNVKWTRTFGGGKYDIVKSVAQSADGGYILAGTTYSAAVIAVNNVYVIKLDSAGNLKWSRAILGGAASANSVVQTTNRSYIITGVTSFFGAGGDDAYMLLLDSAGNSCIPFDSNEVITSIDSGRVGTGGTVNIFTPVVSIDTSSTDTGGVYSVFCSDAKPTKVAPIKPVENKIRLYPNPASSNITLQYQAESTNPLTIKIYSMTGELVMEDIISKVQKGSGYYELHTSTLTNGIYIVQVSNGQENRYLKFVKQ